MNILLNLNINDSDCLQLVSEFENNDFINLCNTSISVWLKYSDTIICVHAMAVGFDLYYLADHINQCLNNKKNIPKNFGNNIDLGLLWNKHIQKIILAEESGKQFKNLEWEGTKLFFLENQCEGLKNCMTFLYNDNHGNIIFETSYSYPWFLEDAQSTEFKISYDDWLPKYKVLYKTMITNEIAQQWIKQLNELYAKLDSNMTCCK